MMYLDSAIIVKLLVREKDSAFFNRSIVGQELWSSELALVEVRSAILIKEREKLLSAPERKSAFARFESLCSGKSLHLHPLNSVVVERAAGLLANCHPEAPLRSLDAIHLATALLRSRGPLCTTDGRLRTAAQRIGVPCFPKELSEIANS
jgi:predicted nucleic acid-binding protein